MKRLSFSGLLILLWGLAVTPSASACHKGGPMGFARNDPGMFSVDVTLSPVFATASTFGTSVCKNWDYVQLEQLRFMESEWDALAGEAARGQGERLVALAGMLGCSAPTFSAGLREEASGVFTDSSSPEEALTQLRQQARTRWDCKAPNP